MGLCVLQHHITVFIIAIGKSECMVIPAPRSRTIYRLEAENDEDLTEDDYPGDLMTEYVEIALIYSVTLDSGLPEQGGDPWDAW